MEEKKKVPEIRFQGFTDDWEQRKLIDYLEVSSEKNRDNRFTKDDVLSVSGEYGIVNQIEFQGRSFAGASVSNYGVVENGDVVYTKSPLKSNPYGIIKTNKGIPGIVSTLYAVYKPKEITDSKFVQIYFELDSRMNSYMHPLVNKGAKNDMKVSAENALKGMVSFPKKDEQEMISLYFSNLDHLITLHQRKHEKLVNVKKSMLERLFVQEGFSEPQIRFGDFKAPWQRAKLGEIVTPYADPVETPHNGYERLGIRSHGKGVFHDYVEAGKELDTAQMHRVAAHNLIVNITFAWEHAVAITVDDDEGKLVSHRFPQFAMTERIYDQFLKYLILDARFRHHLLLSSPGGAGRNRVLKVPEMLEYEMMLPDIEEQKQIAGFLNALDELIELYQIKLEKLKNIKKATLQKMFV